uniref:Uncharacterized protein n=1 Tax=Streptomyces sp. NBC_00049 TaxID=2903617 RepID=A0AAU2JSC6_9ACTN
MGNSRAYPVLRTTDAATAYAQAKPLRALLGEPAPEVGLYAELQTARDVRRIAEVLPGAVFDYVEIRKDPVTGEYLRFDLDVTALDDAELAAHLPLGVMEDVPRGPVEERFVAALGEGMAAMAWQGTWPDDPDADQWGIAKYDGVQIVFHGDCAQWGGSTGHHTLFVHVDKWGDLPRARKLAAHIGSEVLGEEQLGW